MIAGDGRWARFAPMTRFLLARDSTSLERPGPSVEPFPRRLLVQWPTAAVSTAFALCVVFIPLGTQRCLLTNGSTLARPSD